MIEHNPNEGPRKPALGDADPDPNEWFEGGEDPDKLEPIPEGPDESGEGELGGEF